MNKIHEECGVVGIFSKTTDETIANKVYYAIHSLQHRGQEGCGIAVNDDGVITSFKDVGLIADVFTKDRLNNLGGGSIAVGHARYSTSGSNDRVNCQPMVVNHIKGNLALAHNGNLVNSAELRRELELTGSIFHATSDTEVISYLITKERLTAPSIEEAVNRAMARLDGAYSLVIMSPKKMIAVRDPRGFRPLCYGVTESGAYVVASETCALDVLDAKFIREIEPGEIVVFTDQKIFTIDDHMNKKPKSLCMFEYIYFARPDSCIDGNSVHEARLRAGRYLAEEHAVDADVVIGVPDSGIDGAIGYSKASGIPYGIGFIKNKYIGRTFIAPEQGMRETAVKMKLNVVKSTVEGKRVVLIDDSIVRGTTSAIIVKLLRRAGAKEVHMRVTAPKFVNACYYGTDIDSPECLIANQLSLEEIRMKIGVDTLGYLSLENIVKIPNGKDCNDYCLGCFNSKYPTRVPQQKNKYRFESKISENKKNK